MFNETLINRCNLSFHFLLSSSCRAYHFKSNQLIINILLLMILNQIMNFAKQSIRFNVPLKRSFSSKPDENGYGVKFDQEQIRRKMQQIKQKKESPKNRQSKLQFMNIDTNNQLAIKIKKYRQSTDTQNLFHFTDVTIQQKPTTLQITGFDENSIQVDNMVYPHSLIVFPKQVLIWEVLTPESINIDDFIILKYIYPKPTYIIVGMTNPQKFPSDIADYLKSNYQNVDCLQLFQASSQFNTTSNDDINVVAFIISK